MSKIQFESKSQQNIYTYWATGEKIRSATWNPKEMMIAVLETISYHFEPYPFEKEAGKFDLPLMAELMSAQFKKG